MIYRKESGFGVVEIIIVVVVLVVIGLLGWYGFNAYSQQSQQPASDRSTKTQTDDKQTDGATKYLTIKEWGVKFALTTDTADAYYDTNVSTSSEAMSLRSHSLDSEPNCATAPQSVAAIFRVAKDAEDDALPGKMYRETRDGKIVDDYFYFIEGAQYSCTDDVDMQIVLQGVRNAFTTAGPTIQKQ